ncbi:zinc finger protein 512B isoform X4 [Lates japonicus]|uniref:Zinc finger protein 512B isoform X4 n=1 Tax=Lates japonicus TaxID=270547 RepID=A0AAD3QWA9_LATJO|nr:zinc finger protein 512B isoform X4 [Lates japonicus]
MESPSGPRLGKLSSSGLPRGRTPKHGHPQEPVRTTPGPENNNKHMCSSDNQATVAEKLSHGCPYCEAVFATKVRLQKHKLWNHPDRVTVEPKDEQPKLQKTPVKSNTKKRPMENSPPSPVFFKVKKTHEVSTPSQNGELAHQKSERKQHSHSQPSQQIHQSQPALPHPQQSQSQSTSSDAGGSESEGGSLPPSFPDEDPERMKHRRKQKTPKKFTGEQPSISGTFGLKGTQSALIHFGTRHKPGCARHVCIPSLLVNEFATVAEKLSHGCPYCEAVFATKVRLQKHKLWNHPDRVTVEPKDEQPKLQKTPVKSNTKKRPMENSPPSPVFFKVKKTHEVSTPSQNGELAHQKSERKQHSHSQPSQQIHQSQPALPHPQQSQSQSTSSDAGGSESEGGSLPPSFPDEDPERMKHRRKQKTPKKFTGEQPSISGTFGLKGRNFSHLFVDSKPCFLMKTCP